MLYEAEATAAGGAVHLFKLVVLYDLNGVSTMWAANVHFVGVWMKFRVSVAIRR